MTRPFSAVFQNPTARALFLIVLIAPISFYLGTSPVRRGILYYTGVFSPSLIAAIAAGLWTWSWKWFLIVLAACVALTTLIQMFVQYSGESIFQAARSRFRRADYATSLARRRVNS